MANGDYVEEVLDYMDADGADLPKSVTNKMLLIAVRESHRTFRYLLNQNDEQIGMIANRVGDLEEAQINCAAVKAAELAAEKKAKASELAEQSRKERMIKLVQSNPGVAALLGVGAVKLVDWIPAAWMWLVSIF